MTRPAILACALALLGSAHLQPAQADGPSWTGRVGLQQRVPWTNSRIVGSPEPPPPYRIERIYPHLAFKQPVEMIPCPPDLNGTAGPQIAVVERAGQVLAFADDQQSSTTQTLLDGRRQIPGLQAIYGLAFHPRFAENRLCYLCYILEAGRDDGTRVSRFRVTTDDPPVIDPSSETILLTFRSGGHNGGSLKFGPDGCLYISSGDAEAPDPPDGLHTGQDVSDLLSSVLRIDVDHATGDLPYAIPDDNPFVQLPTARPEIWAYGFRNPWRMSFDRSTGDLWVGDVGWQLFEMVYRVERGGNYGWSVMEGPQPVRTESATGPTPILPPTWSLGRADAASVTGGFVYHGERLPDLQGDYIYGDYVTGKVWALKYTEGQVAQHRELTDTPLAIICFYEGPDGEIALLDYNAGTIHRLVPNEALPTQSASFPRKLSETGLFTSTADHVVAPGVIQYSINAPQWMDGAHAERFIAIPDSGTMTLKRWKGNYPKGDTIPPNAVLMKTISIDTNSYRASSQRRIETQILHFSGEDWRGNGGEWLGYTYLWNEDQTDAELAPSDGTELTLHLDDQPIIDRQRTIPWRVHSRAECYTCHNPWAGYRLSFTEAQLDRSHYYEDIHPADQLATLEHLGVLSLPDRAAANDPNVVKKPAAVTTLLDPYDQEMPLDDRARSYLHVNCAHCHRFGGGGTSMMLLDREFSLEESRSVNTRPAQGTFNLPHPALIRPGDPFASVLYYRMAKTGRGHMPHIGAQEVDWEGLTLMQDWINSLAADDDPNHNLRKEQTQLIATLQQHIADGINSQALDAILQSPYHALSLHREVQSISSRWSEAQAEWRPAVQLAARSTDPIIRDLFEQFLPQSERVRRLGSSVDPATILAQPGDADRGRRLFLESQTLLCRNCHRVDTAGKAVGPDLTAIGKQRSRAELLESILDPSRKFDPKFITYLVETRDGLVHTGLLVERSDSQITLRTAENKLIHVESSEIEQFQPQQRSLMPDLLFRDLTAEELADVLAYLESLRGG
ncbi:MAG: PQQ-dependent sugar dehydrogenase [Planctomycetaceae bacterium]|nr:PQQ-dependent sugar dehydrogenase [Planctomycetaceae bacterium]